MRKIISLLLTISILALSANILAFEKRGENIAIYRTKPDIREMHKIKPYVKGELITVKENSLLILDAQTGTDIAVPINEIYRIKIMKGSGALIGAGIGFVVGAAISIPLVKDYVDLEDREVVDSDYVKGIMICGAILALPGALIGSLFKTGKTIKLEGKSDSEIKEILEFLRSKARVKSFQ